MANRNLNPAELTSANELLGEIRKRLLDLSAGAPLLLFAYRRKIIKELGYDERGKPVARAKLKWMKWGRQNAKWAHCGEDMPLKYSELDRQNAADGYTPENTELVHANCGGLRSAPDCRPRRTFLHLSYSYAPPCGPALLVTQDPSATLAVHCGNGFDARFEPYQSARLSRYNAGP
jgi:hypothetical protein